MFILPEIGDVVFAVFKKKGFAVSTLFLKSNIGFFYIEWILA